jgi:uncharacterized protein
VVRLESGTSFQQTSLPKWQSNKVPRSQFGQGEVWIPEKESFWLNRPNNLDLGRLLGRGFALGSHWANLLGAYALTGLHQYFGFVPGLRGAIERLLTRGPRQVPALSVEKAPVFAERKIEGITFLGKSGNRQNGLWMPPKEGHPILVFTSGRGGNALSRHSESLWPECHRLGVGILAYDLRSYGKNKGRFSQAAAMSDLQEWSQFLEREKKYPIEKQVWMGHSLGAAISACTASESERKPKALVFAGSFSQLNTLMSYAKEAMGIPNHWFDKPQISQPFDTLKAVQQLQIPQLFIHGTADTHFPWQFSKQLFEECGALSQQKQLLLYQGQQHVLQWPEVIQGVNTFLEKHT